MVRRAGRLSGESRFVESNQCPNPRGLVAFDHKKRPDTEKVAGLVKNGRGLIFSMPREELRVIFREASLWP